jgi:hypothetical protein
MKSLGNGFVWASAYLSKAKFSIGGGGQERTVTLPKKHRLVKKKIKKFSKRKKVPGLLTFLANAHV